MSATTNHRERITARVPSEVRETLERAADLAGATVNQFVVQAALREAERLIEQEHIIRLSGHGAEAFLRAMEAPPPPNDALLAAIKDYSARRDDQTGRIDWAPQPKSP